VARVGVGRGAVWCAASQPPLAGTCGTAPSVSRGVPGQLAWRTQAGRRQHAANHPPPAPLTPPTPSTPPTLNPHQILQVPDRHRVALPH
jgi:hypothetical protein